MKSLLYSTLRSVNTWRLDSFSWLKVNVTFELLFVFTVSLGWSKTSSELLRWSPPRAFSSVSGIPPLSRSNGVGLFWFEIIMGADRAKNRCLEKSSNLN